jgi:hypothetical protein
MFLRNLFFVFFHIFCKIKSKEGEKMRVFYKKFRFTSFIAIVFVILLNICSFSPNAEFSKQSYLSAEELLDLYENMYSKIHNVHVYYTHILEEIKNESGQMPPYVRFETTETIEEGACEKYYARWTLDPNGFDKPENFSEEAFNGSCTMQYGHETKTGRISPGRTQLAVEQMSMLWAYMLLNRPPLPDQPEKPLIRILFSPKSSVRPQLEQVNGLWCHVIDAPYTVKPWATVWLAVDKGGLPIKFENNEGLGKYLWRINVTKVGSVETETGTVWYPEEATKERIDRDGYRQYSFKVKALEVNVKTSPDTFKLSFPPGTEVIDEVAGLYYTTGETDTDQPIDGIGGNSNNLTQLKTNKEPIVNQNNLNKTLTILLFVIAGIIAFCVPAFYVGRKLMIR